MLDTIQSITSAQTSVNSKKLPVLFSKVNFQPNTINLDIGGGKFDNVTEYLAGKGITNYIYDPYNRTEEHNAISISKTQNKQADTITISNVLCVIREQYIIIEVLKNAAKCLKENGTLYITVYEGDKTGVGKKTKKGYQQNKKLKEYLYGVNLLFNDVIIKKNVIVAKHAKI